MKHFPRDYELTVRMFFTMFLLAALYLFFATVLWQAGLSFSGMIFIVGIMLISQYYFSDRLVLMSTGAKIVKREEAPDLHAIVERLSVLADIPKPQVAVVPTMVPNAFATGRSPSHAVVAVTRGLMERLETPELEAVLGHELSHIKHRDVAVMTIASFFATVASFIVQNFFFLSLGHNDDDRNSGSMILIYLVSIIVWLISFFLIRALSRYREFAADRGSVILTGSTAHLSSALMKISSTMQRIPTKDLRQAESLNAFFIIPALKGSALMELFSTHPSLEKRLSYLRELERQLK